MKPLTKKALHLEPTIRIGKNGLSEAQLKEIEKQLKKKKLVKIKFLKAALEQKNKKQLAEELAKKTSADIVQQTGFVITLYRENYLNK